MIVEVKYEENHTLVAGSGSPGTFSRETRRPELPLPATKETPAGRGQVRLERVAGRTEVTGARATAPLRLLLPRPASARDGPATVVLSSYGGGLVAGDAIDLRVDVRPGAKGLLATQASTKVYVADGGRGCSQVLAATIAAGGMLAVVPDPVTPFAGARYVQHQRFDLAADASLLLVDSLTSGRWARGERWAFASYRSRTEVNVGGRAAFVDGLLLEPSGECGRHFLGRFNCFATAVVVGPAFEEVAEAVTLRSRERRVGRRESVLVAASPLRDGGAVIRVAGPTAEAVGLVLHRELGAVAGPLGVDPWGRK